MPEPIAAQEPTQAATNADIKPSASLLSGETVAPQTTPEVKTEPVIAKADEKAPEVKADGDKPKVDDGKTQGAPEKYEFKTPEGVTLDSVGVEKLSTIAKELNLSNENAQKFADLAVEHTAKLQAAQQKAWHDTRDKWAADLKADKVFGNDKFKESLESGNRGVAYVLKQAPELKQAMDQGLIDQPGIFKAFALLGKFLGEDKTIDGSPSAQNKSLAQIMYPSRS